MEYADIRKKNSAVRRNGGCEVSRGYRAGQVRATLTAQPALLEETGASFLSAQDLRNAGAKHQIPMLEARGSRPISLGRRSEMRQSIGS